MLPQAPPAYASISSPEPADPASIGQHEEVLRERLAGLERRLADRDAEIARQAEENTRLRLEMADQDAAHRAERAEMAASAAAERERLLLLLERATVRPSVIERLLAIIRPSRS
jgi:membrane protein involved in colicin uptake